MTIINPTTKVTTSPFDCFTGDGKIVFYKPGSFTPSSFAFDINNDGTLQTPLGAIKKMGN
jgi:hypothetical protein